MRTVKNLHRARREDIGDLITYQALPVLSKGFEGFEPFILLNHHGPQTFPPGNGGLPFGPHPHRGFETVTFILKGELVHKDTGGYQSQIAAGGVQWMTAGSGLIHAEVSSDKFKQAGGEIDILQLWVNLPARLKMTQPRYTGLQKDEIPAIEADGGKVTVNLVSGEWDLGEAPIEPLTDVHLSFIYFQKSGKFSRNVATERSVLLYVVSGNLSVNGHKAEDRQIVEFGRDGGEEIQIEALTEAVAIFGHALPNLEPIASYGPFVMNTQEEILEAIQDYRAGKFGTWKEPV
jgi:quercetin 2,3-dioxygenase